VCGIAGAIGFVDDEVREAVRRATGRQVHRGPDGEGFYASTEAAGPGVALGHRRLAVIDLSADGAQPMRDPETGAVIVYNGEVFDFESLRRELVAEGRTFRSGTDTEVVLQAYARWGLDFVSRLRGMFALAIWDPRRRRLVLARDHLGVKPLYLARVSRPGGRDVLLFTSELRALLATGLVERRLDPVGLQGFLWHGFVVGPGTLVRGVRRLEPGVRLSVDLDDGLAEREERFWSLPAATPGTHSALDLQRELEAAVRMQLVADVPLGVFASGGVDSSAVMAIAARATGSVLRTFNVGFEEPGFDESRHARAVAQRLGTEHSEVRLSERVFQERLDDALGSVDQPTFDALNTYFVSRAAREAGLTVALAGTGGDELFGGYASFRELPLLARASRVARLAPRSTRRAVARVLARLRLGAPGAVAPQTRWGKLAAALDLGGDLLDLYQLSHALFLPDFLRALAPGLDPGWGRSGLQGERAQRLAAVIRGSPVLHAISLLELASFVGERLLPDTDASSMAVSLEVRVPLLDHRVVETLAGLAPRTRFEPLGRKLLLLRAAGLDPADFARPKHGFELPLARWIRAGLRERVGELLGERAACESIGLEPRAVARLWQAYLAGAPGIYWSRPWSVFVLLTWCREQRVML